MPTGCASCRARSTVRSWPTRRSASSWWARSSTWTRRVSSRPSCSTSSSCRWSRRPRPARSTNADVLEELAIMHPLPAAILEHRQLAKLKGTYLDALPREINRAHRAHPHQVRAGRGGHRAPVVERARTCRTSRSAPSSVARSARAFVAAPGFRIFAADYSQIELRVLAHMSGDPELDEAFSENDARAHRTAQALFGGRARARDARPACRRQDRQLRGHLRADAVRSGAQPAHRAR